MVRIAPGIALLWLTAFLLCLASCRPTKTTQEPQEVVKALPGRFAVAVADFDGDDQHQSMKTLVRQELTDLSSVVESLQVLDIPRLVAVPQSSDPRMDVMIGHENARALLRETGASLVLWGQVQGVNDEDKKAVLYITMGAHRPDEGRAKHYVPRSTELKLPLEFWQHLGDVLALLVLSESAEYEERGLYLVERVLPFIEKVEGLRTSEEFRETWSRESQAAIDFVLGYSWTTVGRQAGDVTALHNAVAAYRAALEGYSKDRLPLEWATTQLNLGATLAQLGMREQLEGAVAAFRAALEVFKQDSLPHYWAMAQCNLGAALVTLGKLDEGTERLEEAVAAFRVALEVQTRDRSPEDWATTQNNLGVALAQLGEREDSVERLEEAVEIFRASLEVRTRDRRPLHWAATRSNLGIALTSLGEWLQDTERLEEAIGALRDALRERTRDRHPLDWAMTQSHLAWSITCLAVRKAGLEQLDEAVAMAREVLEVYTRDQHPHEWAKTHRTLGRALVEIGSLTGSFSSRCDALASYLEAWTVLRELPWERRQIETDLKSAEDSIATNTEMCPNISMAHLADFHTSLSQNP